MQDAPFSIKRAEYAISDFKLTKSLAVGLGTAGGNKKVAGRLTATASWAADSLERRHRELGTVIGNLILGSPVLVGCSVASDNSPFVAVPTFPHPPHLARVLAGVNIGLRTPTDLVSVVESVTTVGVIHQALGALAYLGLVFGQEGSWDLTETGQAVCSESNTQMAVEIAELIVSDPSLLRCAQLNSPSASPKVKRAAKAFSWAQDTLAAG